jgi:Zn-dependent protease/predicted transcriptional regulator
MKYSLYLGKILGVKIFVHWTFAFLVGWIVISTMRAGLGVSAVLWTLGLVLAIFGCIVLHELGHALAGRKYKVQTKHITLLPIGGVAQLETIPENPKQELVIALAGPAVNFIIVLILYPFANSHTLLDTESLMNIGASNFLFFLITVNLWLALFNLIPAFPMDGGRVLRALLAIWLGHGKATRVASVIGQLFGIAFFLTGFVYSPSLIFIGIFIVLSAQYEKSLVQTVEFLHKYKVLDVIIRDIPSIESSSSVKDAAQVLLSTQNKNFVVTTNGKPVGTITRDEIVKAMETVGEKGLIENVKSAKLSYVSESTPLDEAWKIMQGAKSPLILVGMNGSLTGIVEEENIAELMLLQSAAAMSKR